MAVKLYQSVSISGPSTTLKPMRFSTSTIRFMVIETGWRLPVLRGSPGAVTSKAEVSAWSSAASVASWRAANFSSATVFAALMSCPYSFFRSFSTLPISPKSGFRTFLEPIKRKRNCSTSSLFVGFEASISSITCCTFAKISTDIAKFNFVVAKVSF